MNNITPLFSQKPNRPEAFNSDSELYFDVWERPAFFQGRDVGVYYGDSNHKHIVRMWDGSPLSIGLVGKNYSPERYIFNLQKDIGVLEQEQQDFWKKITNSFSSPEFWKSI